MSDCEIAYSNFDCPTRIMRMKKKHVLLHGFEHSNDVFGALSILTEKED